MSLGVEKMDTMIEMTMLRSDPDRTFGFTWYQGREIQSLTSGMPGMGMGIMNFMQRPMFDHRNFNYTLEFAWAREMMDRRNAMAEMLDAKTSMLSGMLNMHVEKYWQSIESAGVSRGRVIPNSQSALDVIRSGYTTGANDFNDLIMAELSLLKARMGLVDHEKEKRLALAEIERLLGRKVPVNGSDNTVMESES